MSQRHIEHHIRHVASHTAPWLVCVSGGADSMTLLHATVRTGISAVAAHCNFHLRGEESDRDEKFVISQCHSLGVECLTRSFDTAEYCRRHKISLEMGCRELRYEWFLSLMRDRALARIAVAHNADDDNETMLLNLFRGTGIAGLTGMSPDTGSIIRPLLPFSRNEIESYLNSIGAEWVTDSTNLSSDYKRNFLRNEIIPALRSRWPGLSKSLIHTREYLMQTQQIADSYLAGMMPEDREFLPASLLASCPAPQALIHAWITDRGATASQEAEMATAASGARWILPQGMVIRSASGLRYISAEAPAPVPELCVTSLPVNADTLEEVRSNRSHDTLFCAPAAGLHMREARADDRIMPLGMTGTTRVSKVLKEAGLDQFSRSHFHLLADGHDRVIWLPGIKRSRLLTINPEVTHILKITLRP